MLIVFRCLYLGVSTSEPPRNSQGRTSDSQPAPVSLLNVTGWVSSHPAAQQSSFTFYIAALIFLLGLLGLSSAQRPHSKVKVTGLLAKHSDGHIPSGSVIPLLFNVENGADKVVNVTVAWAHLYNQADYSRGPMYNFTGLLITELVNPGKEASFEYRFGVPPVKEPLEANFVALVEYTFSKTGQKNYV
jgi:hypothetical protein